MEKYQCKMHAFYKIFFYFHTFLLFILFSSFFSFFYHFFLLFLISPSFFSLFSFYRDLSVGDTATNGTNYLSFLDTFVFLLIYSQRQWIVPALHSKCWSVYLFGPSGLIKMFLNTLIILEFRTLFVKYFLKAVDKTNLSPKLSLLLRGTLLCRWLYLLNFV